MSDRLELVKKAIDDKLGRDLNVIDMSASGAVTDYFVICTGNTPNHTQAIADAVEEAALKAGMTVRGKEGFREGSWILVDLEDIVIHIFTQDQRDYYGLEHLWSAPEAE